MKKTILFLLCLFSSLSADSPPIDLSEGSGFANQLLHMFLSLGGVLLLLLAGAWILKQVLGKRMQQMNQYAKIKIVEQRTLSPKAAIYIIEVEKEQILIAETAAGVTKLSTLCKQDEQEEAR